MSFSDLTSNMYYLGDARAVLFHISNIQTSDEARLTCISNTVGRNRLGRS